jgi:hypothetical protein
MRSGDSAPAHEREDALLNRSGTHPRRLENYSTESFRNGLEGADDTARDGLVAQFGG